MSDNQLPDNAEMAYQQALKYGKDLARVYVAEKAKREKLELAYQALDAIFASTPDGLVFLNDGLVIQQANSAFAKLVESDLLALLGKPIREVLFSDELMEVLKKNTAGNVGPTQVELAVNQPTGRALTANVARLRAGQLRGWVLSIRDESARRRLERQKGEFINVAAHELRTPLTGVLGYLEILKETIVGTLGGPPADWWESAYRSAQRLNGIVDELLQFANINSGTTLSSEIVPFAVSSLVNEVIADLSSAASDKQVEVTTAIDPGLQMTGDLGLVRSALLQLLLNAINFNKPGGIVRVEAEPAADDELEIRVIDSGVGIPQSDLESIFQPFFQVEEHNTRKTGGLGLGLSIVQRAANKLSGRVLVQSTLGEGSTFTLRLPLEARIGLGPGLGELQEQLESTRKQSLAYARDVQALYRQLQERNRQLQKTNTQLEEANRLKSNFLGVISHELRTPFVGIDFGLQTFARHGLDRLSPQQQELYTQITDGFQNARQMIDHLVVYAGLLSKQGPLNLQSVNVEGLLQEIVETLAPMAKTRRLSLEAKVTSGLVLPEADRERLSEAVWHLVHNAIKYTKAGGEITVKGYPVDEHVAIEVKDSGIGISADRQAQIWEAFEQLADPLRRGAEGLGLGLPLVRYVATAHGGDVTLHSEPGVGSVFTIWLPVKHTTAEQ